MKKQALKVTSLFLSTLLLLSGCASTTLINCNVPDANLYLDGVPVGNTPYSMTDTKIVGSRTTVKIKKQGYETLNTTISRDEQADVGAIIGGLLVWVPFLWTMKYNPVHYYELELNTTEVITPKSVDYIEELRKLKNLLDDGVITQSEYDSKKKTILEEN